MSAETAPDEDPRTARGNFTMLPNVEARDESLADAAYRLNVVLHSAAGKKGHCQYSEATLARLIGKTVRTVRRAARELEAKGLWTVQRRPRATNVYRYTGHQCPPNEVERTLETVTPDTHVPSRRTPETQEEEQSKEDSSKKKDRSILPHSTPNKQEPTAEEEDAMAEVLSVYARYGIESTLKERGLLLRLVRKAGDNRDLGKEAEKILADPAKSHWDHSITSFVRTVEKGDMARLPYRRAQGSGSDRDPWESADVEALPPCNTEPWRAALRLLAERLSAGNLQRFSDTADRLRDGRLILTFGDEFNRDMVRLHYDWRVRQALAESGFDDLEVEYAVLGGGDIQTRNAS